ncbi:MAG TPA: ABC transporter substrate-binding protein [Ktedonobacterales bacterium]|nr:ABC transporter substrate-binding protein [Ktedonobacterales bacterium]
MGDFASLRLRLRSFGVLLLAALALTMFAGCGPSSASGSLHHLTVGLTYIPNIQFAPFYVADSLGYYKDAGLSVTLRHHSFTEDEFGAVAAGKEDAVFGGGDEMLQARDHNIPLVYVASMYVKYPVALIVPANSPIHTAADLRGHTIGTPGAYGETYFGLLALLQSAGLSQSDVKIQNIGFSQVAALLGHKVDAVMGYVNNEAVQFQQDNFPVRTLALSDVVPNLPLISNGLGALQSKLGADASDIKALVAATLRGVQYTVAHPQQALDISEKYVPGLSDPKNAAQQLAVLQATIPLWKSNGAKPGYNDPTTWQAMASFMPSYGLLSAAPDVTKAYSNAYLP